MLGPARLAGKLVGASASALSTGGAAGDAGGGGGDERPLVEDRESEAVATCDVRARAVGADRYRGGGAEASPEDAAGRARAGLARALVDASRLPTFCTSEPSGARSNTTSAPSGTRKSSAGLLVT